MCKNMIRAGLTAMLALVASMLPLASHAQSVDDWKWQATVYGWFPSISGKTSFPSGGGGPTIDVDADDIVSDLNGAFMGSLEFQRGRWGLWTDVIYFNIDGSKSATQNATIGRQAIPVGATLSDGTHTFTATPGTTSVDVSLWTLSALTVTPPADSGADFNLTVTAISTEASNGDEATIKGTLVVGVVQGAIGAVLFLALGIPAPIFWGTLMAMFSVLPAVGPGLVWLPAAVILLGMGQIVKGIIVIAAGVLVIGLVDNVLRPLLVGRDTQMPDYLVLLATLGGLAVFGIAGFVIGPVIAAFFLVVWEMLSQEYAEGTIPREERPTLEADESNAA
jgi:hypothetical protein